MTDERTDRLAQLLVHLVGHKTCVGYVIALTNGETLSITCLICGLTSFNPTDVDQKYCGACHVFHADQIAARPIDHELWVVWSFEHDAWWRPNRWGYTPNLAEAGRYTQSDALEIERRANVVRINEQALPLADAEQRGAPEPKRSR